ncbi:MAG: hypothetical protein K2N79_02840, partial [Muribaculaceae bacterium]|nr:hypothetical protein [Muribaculaceae bacterium]
MQDSIQKLWSDSVEIEGIAASLVLRNTDDQYISSILPLLKSKIASLDSLVNSIQLNFDEPEPCVQPADEPEPVQPLYREILKETIVIESSRPEPTENQEEPQPVDEIVPELNPERELAENTEVQIETSTESETEANETECEPSPLPVIFRPNIIENYVEDEDISEDPANRNYNSSDIAIEPDPDTEPAIEPEEFEPVLDPEPEVEQEAEQDVEQDLPQEVEQTAQATETKTIDSAVETEEKIEESIADKIDEVAHADPIQSEENQPVIEESGTIAETPQTEEAQPEAEPIKAEIEPELPVAEPDDPQQTESAPAPSNTESESPISLDQKLSRKISKNFRQAISLNDKFRFRRELFGNSSQQYDAALDLIGEMSSF